MEPLITILRQSLRGLKAQPGFACLVIAGLGLGIGANCGLFTVVNSLLLRPLPYRNPHELVENLLPRIHPPVEELRRVESITGIAAYGAWGFSVAGPEGVRNYYGFRVTANLFTVLGVHAAVGRTLSPNEDQQPVVMLSYDFWRRISGNPNIIGQTITVSGGKYTIVGVTPPGFWLGVRDANLFVPDLRTEKARIFARLKPGVTRAQAYGEVTGMVRGAQVVPLSEAFWSDDYRPILVLQGAIGLVLLITCANVANLLLVRSAARRREFAIRAALGGGRAHLFGQLMTESAVLGALGAALGLLLAYWSLSPLEAGLPVNISRRLIGTQALSIDFRVVAFTAGMALATVLLFGLAPAMSALRLDLISTLRDSGKGAAPHRQRLGQLLVIGEVGLALMLLMGAALMIKTLAGLRHQYLGFSGDHVLRGAVDLLQSRYQRPEQRVAVFTNIVDRLKGLPGVETVGVLAPQFFPFGGPLVRGDLFEIQGRPAMEARAEVYTASPDYFRSVRIPLLRGRLFGDSDTATSPPVAIVSAVVAQRYWGQEDPVGRMIRLNSERAESPWVTIIGVVGDVRNPVALDVQPTAYRPFAQNPSSGAILMIRTAGGPMSLVEAVRRTLYEIDPTAPEIRAADLERSVRDYVSPQRFTTSLLGSFAAAGLLLAAMGIYGVMRYWVAGRIPEIGMRMALGAQRKDVLSLVLGKAARTSLIGVAFGIGGALALQRVIATQLIGVSPTDPVVFVIVSVVMAAVAIVAAWLPARWAAKVDPLVALRHE